MNNNPNVPYNMGTNPEGKKKRASFIVILIRIIMGLAVGELGVFGTTVYEAFKRKEEVGPGKFLFTLVLSGLTLVLVNLGVAAAVWRKTRRTRICLVTWIVDFVLTAFWLINFGVYTGSYMKDDDHYEGDIAAMRRRMWLNMANACFIVVIGFGHVILWLKIRKEGSAKGNEAQQPQQPQQYQYPLSTFPGGHQPGVYPVGLGVHYTSA